MSPPFPLLTFSIHMVRIRYRTSPVTITMITWYPSPKNQSSFFEDLLIALPDSYLTVSQSSFTPPLFLPLLSHIHTTSSNSAGCLSNSSSVHRKFPNLPTSSDSSLQFPHSPSSPPFHVWYPFIQCVRTTSRVLLLQRHNVVNTGSCSTPWFNTLDRVSWIGWDEYNGI